MNYHKIILVILLFQELSIYSQNIVPNSSFEEHQGCPKNFNVISTKTNSFTLYNWFSATSTGSPDYFSSLCREYSHIDSTSNRNMHISGVSYRYIIENIVSKEGHGFLGLILFSELPSPFSAYREYIEVKLTKPLKKDKKYCCHCYYLLADFSTCAIGNFGMYFSNKPINNKGNIILDNQNQYLIMNTLMENNMNFWECTASTYKAKGGEKYLTIGIFLPQNKVQFQLTNKGIGSNKLLSYYFIDNVEVFEISNDSLDCQIKDFTTNLLSN